MLYRNGSLVDNPWNTWFFYNLVEEEPFIVTFQEKGGKKWEYDEFFFQNQENAGESGSIAALRELSQKDKNEYSITVLQFYFKGCAFPQFYLILYIYIYIYI